MGRYLDYRDETPKARTIRIHTVTQSSARVKQCLWTDILPTPLFSCDNVTDW